MKLKYYYTYIIHNKKMYLIKNKTNYYFNYSIWTCTVCCVNYRFAYGDLVKMHFVKSFYSLLISSDNLCTEVIALTNNELIHECMITV